MSLEYEITDEEYDAIDAIDYEDYIAERESGDNESDEEYHRIKLVESLREALNHANKARNKATVSSYKGIYEFLWNSISNDLRIVEFENTGYEKFI